MTDEQRIRQRMIYVRHYFPGVNLDTISDEEFAMLSEEALWLHEQMLISRMPVPMSLPEAYGGLRFIISALAERLFF